jgi:tetratricopeptide (TPR) repeat protein
MVLRLSKKCKQNNASIWASYSVLISTLAYFTFSHLSNHLMEADDFHYMLQSARTSLDFTAFFSPEYHGPRPLTDLVFWLGYEVWGDNPRWYRIFLVGFHTAASLLLARVSYELTKDVETSMLGGLFFLLNIAHFRIVYNISGLAYVLALIWILLAIYCYLMLLKTLKDSWSIWLCVATILAVLSHAAAIAVIPFLAFIAIHKHVDLQFTLIRLSFAVVLSGSCVFCLTYFFPEKVQSYHTISVVELSTISKHFFWLWSRLITTAHWLPLPIYLYQTWELYVGIAGFAVIVMIFFSYRGSMATAWIFWTLITMLPFITRAARSFEADATGPSRYLYLASAGSSIVLAYMLVYGRKFVGRHASIVVARVIHWTVVICITVHSIWTFNHIQAFSFFANGKFNLDRGLIDLSIQQFEAAIAHGSEIIPLEEAYVALSYGEISRKGNVESSLRRGLQEFPESFKLHAIAGALKLLSTDNLEQQSGHEWLNRSREFADSRLYAGRPQDHSLVPWGIHEYDPFVASTFKVIGDAAFWNDQKERSVNAYRQYVMYSLDKAEALCELGSKYGQLGNYVDAVEVLRQSVAINERNGSAYYNLALAYKHLGYSEDAIVNFEKAIELFPRSPKPFYHLGLILYEAGKYKELINNYTKILPERPSLTSDFYELEVLYKKLSRSETANAFFLLGESNIHESAFQKAAEAYQNCIRVMPEHQMAHYKLTLAYLLLKDVDAANTEYMTLKEVAPDKASELSHFFE